MKQKQIPFIRCSSQSAVWDVLLHSMCLLYTWDGGTHQWRGLLSQKNEEVSFIIFFSSDKVSLCSSGWSKAQQSSASASRMLRLKTCAARHTQLFSETGSCGTKLKMTLKYWSFLPPLSDGITGTSHHAQQSLTSLNEKNKPQQWLYLCTLSTSEILELAQKKNNCKNHVIENYRHSKEQPICCTIQNALYRTPGHDRRHSESFTLKQEKYQSKHERILSKL